MLHIPSRNFIVAAAPRTGTNFLCNTLCHRGDLRYHGEYYPEDPHGNYLEPLFSGQATGRSKFLGDPGSNGRGQFAKLFYGYLVHPLEDGGFKVRWDILNYLKGRKMSILHLRRRNLLDTAISYAISMRDGTFIYHKYKNPIEMTAKDLTNKMWWPHAYGTRLEESMRHAGVRHLDLWYEDIVYAHQMNADRIADFLHLPKKEVQLSGFVVKQRHGRQSENLANYDEMKEHFKGSFYAQFFED